MSSQVLDGWYARTADADGRPSYLRVGDDVSLAYSNMPLGQ